ncbi:unnamed protein product [Rotaria magnacalcarata]|uniref:Protein kinase domain-containing protein n=2 Tax=Rotaria magnacalcarata TaxID=392030 RepID=A0A815YHI2_9BILA|nr:unnamed protein product [Rotaria magnacalcarata]CAF1661962.1 unnamed protein product [Rotaria magnacalcarata]CAF2223610.1 unnamed protein product [Rotaria magnacalcarata]CAF4007815.1 unnamed protein product [Rotaria magnacalcarata]CAF4058651.1 unnamed protein product [Rotaria magnacalcarata]
MSTKREVNECFGRQTSFTVVIIHHQRRLLLTDVYGVMSKGTHKQFSVLSTRQITHTRLYDDGILETKYEISNKLGEGSFGTVYRVRNKETDLFYAMKTIAKKPGNKIKAISLDNEVKLLEEINHPNLIQLHEVLESSQNLYLIVELCEGGELGLHVKKIGPLPEETIKQIMSKLVSALYYLHKMDIVHRDLKLENILLKNTPTSKTDEFDIRVTDFGLSSKKSITNTDSLFNEYCGTPLYMAPEILENKNYSALCDVWALGIIMYYLICGRHAYIANDERRLLEIIRSTKLRYDSERFKNLTSEGLDFLQGMIVYDTVHRRTMGELTVHPWLTGRSDKGPTKDIITMMKEFQAENERRRTNLENNPTMELNAASNDIILQSISNDESETVSHSTSSKQDYLDHQIKTTSNQTKSNTLERRATVDRNKLNFKTNRLTTDVLKTSRRSNNVANESNITSPNSHLQMKHNDRTSSLTDSSQIRQTSNTPSVPSSSTTLSKLGTRNIQFGRSQSHADLLSSPKLTHQRTVSNNSLAMGAFPSSSTSTPPSSGHITPTLNKTSPSSATTALMMIHKNHSKNSSSSLPTISNRHHHTHNISLSDKRYSNHT